MDQSLIELLTLDIPKPEPYEFGFLDVVDHTTRENTISNVYSYFLDSEKSPQLSSVLIESLLELIEEKYDELNIRKQLDLADYSVQREVGITKGRIDLVIESKLGKSVILIEAKIYHWLANSLSNYRKAFESKYANKRMALIVLSLEKMQSGDLAKNNFICITHTEWLNKAVSKGIPLDLPINEVIYFKDFVKNMNRITKSTEMNEQAEFFFEYAEKINQAIKTKKEAEKFVKAQFEAICGERGWGMYWPNQDWAHLYPVNKRKEIPYYWITPRDIVENFGELRLVLEVGNESIGLRGEFHKIISEEFKDFNLKLLTTGPHHAAHIFERRLRFKTIDEFKNMKSRVLEVLDDLEVVRKRLAELVKDGN